MSDISPEEIAYAMDLALDEKANQRAILKARHYHDGRQPVALTDRLREFLNIGTHQSAFTGGMYWANPDAHSPFCMNVTRIVVNAVTERMIVAGFDTDEEKERTKVAPPPVPSSNANGTAPAPFTPPVQTKALATPVADWAWTVWTHNKMDAAQDDIHTDTIRDGESFVIVDWDAAATPPRPRFTPHPRYVDPEVGGDGFGCRAFYPNNNDSLPMLYATKRWSETTYTNGRRRVEQRLNVYYPDRIEQLYQKGGEWQPYAPPILWIDRTGKPLGIAVVHYRNTELRPEAWDAFGLQDALNKAIIDLVAAADLTAFRMYFVTGMYPTEDGLAPQDDGSNAMLMSPGAMFGTMNTAATLQVVEGADLANLLNVKHGFILDIAMVTDTPVSRFTTSAQTRAEGTLKQQESPLLGKIRKRQTLIGNGHEAILVLARRLANAFGNAGLDELAELSTRWEPAEVRDKLADHQALILEQQLGVPDSVIWAKLGYSPAEIEAMQGQKQAQSAANFQAQQQLIQAHPPMAAPPMNGNGKPVVQG